VGWGSSTRSRIFKLKRFVALKVLPPHLMDSPELRERFLVEAQAAAALTIRASASSTSRGGRVPPLHRHGVREGETLRDRIERPVERDVDIDKPGRGRASGRPRQRHHPPGPSEAPTSWSRPRAGPKVMDFGLASSARGSSLTTEPDERRDGGLHVAGTGPGRRISTSARTSGRGVRALRAAVRSGFPSKATTTRP